jgi:PAS domain S-box-containing protein
MTNKEPIRTQGESEGPAELRRRAEELVGQEGIEKGLSAADKDTLIHELEVHQIELKLQNEELRRAQRELELSRDRYTDLFEFAPVGYFLLDRYFRIINVNFTGIRLLGAERKGLIGSRFTKFVPPDYKDALYGCFKTAGKEDGEGCEVRMHQQDGTPFFADLKVVKESLVGSDGVYRVAVTDITGHKQAKELIIKDSAIASAVAGIALADINGKLTYINRALLKMWGYQEEKQVLGKQTGLFFTEASLEQEAFRNAVDEGAWEGELQGRRKDGSVFDVHVTASLVRDLQGKPICVMASFLDISERKQIEEQLARQASLLNTVMENTGAMLAYFDHDFNFIMANKAYIDGCGHTWEEIKGKNHFYCFPNAENEAIFRRVRDTGETITFKDKPFEYADQPWRGITYWDWTLVPIRNNSNRVTGLVLSLIETTERKKVEIELAHLASFPEQNPNPILELDEFGNVKYLNPASKTFFHNLTKKEKLDSFLTDWESLVRRLQTGDRSFITHDVCIEQRWYEQAVTYLPSNHTYRIYVTDITERKKVEQIKDEFLSLVSHELRTPLTVISGSLKTAMNEAASPENIRELLQGAAENVDVLSGILENMLELTRYQAGRLQLTAEVVDLRMLTTRVIDKLNRYGAAQQFEVDIPDDLPAVQADPLRVERVLHNLLNNAVKYSPEQSKIKVLARVEEDFLVTSVIDQGSGISSEAQKTLFQLFNRLDKQETTSGTGLGLVVCKRLLEAHGGWIKVESGEGQGSTFSFGLPLHPED